MSPGVTISCFDRSRLMRLFGTTYAREMEKWYVLYRPDVPSGCGGYVIPPGNRTDALRNMDGGAEQQDCCTYPALPPPLAY